MLPKPGKNHKEVNNYRPITTTSKLLEKCIAPRLRENLDDNDIIPSTQFGFRQGHSTIHQLQRISEIIERGYESKQYTTIAFLDISKAFDKVWIQGLMYKLLKIKLPTNICAILFSFLNDRTFNVKVNAPHQEQR
jgi:hypothetical protein